MGNCCVYGRGRGRVILPSCVLKPKQEKVGKGDLCGSVVGLSQDASHHHHLPPNFELNMLPPPGSCALPPPHSLSLMEHLQKSSTTTRLRVVITKKQLQHLLAQQLSIQELISQQQQQLHKTRMCNNLESSSSPWKPVLAPIPEGVE